VNLVPELRLNVFLTCVNIFVVKLKMNEVFISNNHESLEVGVAELVYETKGQGFKSWHRQIF
jgi:hypothetical protein